MAQALNPHSAHESITAEARKTFSPGTFYAERYTLGHLQHAGVLYQSWFVVWVEITKIDNFEEEKLQFTFPPHHKQFDVSV